MQIALLKRLTFESMSAGFQSLYGPALFQLRELQPHYTGEL